MNKLTLVILFISSLLALPLPVRAESLDIGATPNISRVAAGEPFSVTFASTSQDIVGIDLQIQYEPDLAYVAGVRSGQLFPKVIVPGTALNSFIEPEVDIENPAGPPPGAVIATDYCEVSGKLDQTCIQRGMDRVPAGGSLYIPPGIYTINRSIGLKSNISIGGAGNSTVLKIANGAKKVVVFEQYQSDRVTISNLVFDGNKDNISTEVSDLTPLIFCIECSNITVRSNVFQNFSFNAIRYFLSLKPEPTKSITVTNNIFRNMGGKNGDNRISQSVVEVSNNSGLMHGYQGVDISDNVFTHLSNVLQFRAIRVVGSQGVKIYNNYISDFQNTTIQTPEMAAFGIEVQASENVSIDRNILINIIDNNPGDADSGVQYGFAIATGISDFQNPRTTNVSNIRITNNLMRNVVAGIGYFDAVDGIIANNFMGLFGGRGDCIELNSNDFVSTDEERIGTRNLEITNNQCLGGNNSSMHVSANNVQIQDNLFVGQRKTGLNFASYYTTQVTVARNFIFNPNPWIEPEGGAIILPKLRPSWKGSHSIDIVDNYIQNFHPRSPWGIYINDTGHTNIRVSNNFVRGFSTNYFHVSGEGKYESYNNTTPQDADLPIGKEVIATIQAGTSGTAGIALALSPTISSSGDTIATVDFLAQPILTAPINVTATATVFRSAADGTFVKETVTIPKVRVDPQAQISGDIDKNGKVDIFDYNLLVTDFGKTTQTPADIDGNGKVDIFDYNILVGNFGK